MPGMAGSVEIKDGVAYLRVTVPRHLCVSDRSIDRRTKRRIGSPSTARALANEVDALIVNAGEQDKKLRARDVLRQASRNLEGRLPGASPAAAVVTVDDYSSAWLTSVTGSTLRSYRDIYANHLREQFGDLPLDRVRPRIVREWVQGMLRRGLAPNTAKLHFRALSSLLSQAVRDEELDRNRIRSVWRQMNRGKKKPTRRKPQRTLTHEERGAVVVALREHEPSEDKRLALEVLMATGCRVSEALGLQWSDIDGRDIEIARQLYKGEQQSPKNGKTRTVKVAASMAEQLRRHRVGQQERALARGRRAGPWMFQGTTGKPLAYSTLSKAWLEALRAAGLMAEDDGDMRAQGLNPHVLRHTYATLLLRAGRDLAQVAEWLGQHPTTTMSYYWHAIPKDREALVVDLDAEMGR